MRFISDLDQELVVEKVLPFEFDAESDAEEREQFIYEPDYELIIDDLLKQYFREKIYWILLTTKTSEHAIRRRAMRDATDNANELIEDLNLKYNKARQQQITREIADIMGGAEALRNSG